MRRLKKQTEEEVYEKEFHSGTLNANCQDFLQAIG